MEFAEEKNMNYYCSRVSMFFSNFYLLVNQYKIFH